MTLVSDNATSLPSDVVREIHRFGESVSAAIKIARQTQRDNPELLIDRPITEAAPRPKKGPIT